jgi:hypothetical protein
MLFDTQKKVAVVTTKKKLFISYCSLHAHLLNFHGAAKEEDL